MTSRYLKLDGLAVHTVENDNLAYRINDLIECDVDLLKRHLRELNFRQTLQLHECVADHDVRTLKALLEQHQVFVEYPVYGNNGKSAPARDITKAMKATPPENEPEEPEEDGDTDDAEELLDVVKNMTPAEQRRLKQQLKK